jgi:hypothetical protein
VFDCQGFPVYRHPRRPHDLPLRRWNGLGLAVLVTYRWICSHCRAQQPTKCNAMTPWRHDEQEEIPAPCWLITLHFAMQKQWDCSKTTPRYRQKISYIIERTRLFYVLKCSGGPTLFKLLLY